jgi:four helix bundle protein
MENDNEPAVTPEIVEKRLEQFALKVLRVTRPLLYELEGRDSAVQLRRAATGAFSNYGAARVARSHADFTSKMGVALEEADESHRWLRLVKAAGLLKDQSLEQLIVEAGELRAILSSSHLTAKQNREKYRRLGR